MRTYMVWLKGMTKLIEVQADDVNLNCAGDNVTFWNFTLGPVEANGVSVAAFPFENVEYITSQQGSQ